MKPGEGMWLLALLLSVLRLNAKAAATFPLETNLGEISPESLEVQRQRERMRGIQRSL